jgi:uncharacterized RDD family membrane protein YckC
MRRGRGEEPDLWSDEPAPEPAPAIDEIMEGGSDDPLGRVLLDHPPALFPEGDPSRHAPDGTPAESVSLFAGDAETPPDPAPPPIDFAAPAAARVRAIVVDGVICAVVSSASFLSAAALLRRSPPPEGWLWCAAFALLLSFFLVVPTLALFGKTPGMALADLSADDSTGEKPPIAASIRRWVATASTIFTAGLPLLTVLFDRRRRTPADFLSGRPLHAEREPLA